MNDKLAIQNRSEMSTLDKQGLILSYAREMGREIERPGIIKKMLYAVDNDYPLSLAVTGGLNIISGNRVEVEAKPLKHRIAKDKNYHLQTIEATATTNTKHLYRRASDLWPFHLSDKDAKDGDWVKVGESTFTIDDAKKIIINNKPLVNKDTYTNFPTRMLEYRNTMKIISLYGDGLFASPTYYAGEISNGGVVQDDIIEGETVPTLAELKAEYGDGLIVQWVMSGGDGDMLELQRWLEENEDDE